MVEAKPQQITTSQQLDGPKSQHPLGHQDQANAQAKSHGNAHVEGLPFTGGIGLRARNGSQGNGVIRGENQLQRHQHWQQGQQLAPAIHTIEQWR